MARTRPHSSEAFPAPVAPAISRCVPCSRTSQGSPSSRRPTGSALRSGLAGIGQGGDDGGQGVADLSGGSYCLTVSTTLARTDATAPFASGLALKLHWPLCLPEVYLGSKPAK